MRRSTFKLFLPVIALVAAAFAGAQSVSTAWHSVRHLQPIVAHLSTQSLDSAPRPLDDSDGGCAFCESGSSVPAIHRIAPTRAFRAPAQVRQIPWNAENDAEFFDSAFSPRAPPAVSL